MKRRSKRPNKRGSLSASVRQSGKRRGARPSGPRYASARELIRAKALEGKTAELALSLSMMQATLDSTTDAIVVTDLNGNVRNFNEKYAEMMGVTRSITRPCSASS